MPRAKKTDKFFIYAPDRSGPFKGKRFMGINLLYEGGQKITVQDLCDFLKEMNIDPATVQLWNFSQRV